MPLIKLPKDTKNILNLKQDSYEVINEINPALLIGKYSAFIEDKAKKLTNKEYLAKIISGHIENINKEGWGVKLKGGILNKSNQSNKQVAFLEANYEKNNFISKNFELTGSLIVGIGSESVAETNITLHHIYGIPYIPGSAIKGNLRSYIIREFFNVCGDSPDIKNSKNEAEALKDSLFCHIFGTEQNNQEQNGNLCFLDSFPITYKAKVDIMNPHYSKYYKGQEYPTDTNNPVPIFFIVINNATFQFNIGVKVFDNKTSKDNELFLKYWESYNNTNFTDFIVDLLIKMLDEKGVGAKTSSGYGFMSPSSA